jgi:hypothetical protein
MAGLIDCHVHLAALPDADNGCFVSRKMLRSPLFRFLLWKHRFDVGDPARTNRKYVDDLWESSRPRSTCTRPCCSASTACTTPGRTRFGTHRLPGGQRLRARDRARAPRSIPRGVSINPQRRDAIDEVHRCADAGAALVKVLPNAQQFDPSRDEYKRVYRALAERKLPFLSHVGYEFSLIGRDQSVGDPLRLRVALDEGATVIAAHACSYGLMVYEKFLPALVDLCRRYPNFYADVSALTLPNRFRMLLHLRRHPELHERLLFGTDYPLSVFHCACWGRMGWKSLMEIVRTKNRFDRQWLICDKLGVKSRSIGELLRT